ncbi:sigma-70 family RNA polymerase sigma factor [candidate division KSB1 bacterium]|nr:sigma-70 family RNA polymerase sigma factor [candidate division KSB1 bacterium]TDI78742.1 MAG: sigma-70 family RNA polymerase sigma factor [Caldithrix sp.]
MVEEFGSSSQSKQSGARDKRPSDEDLIERFQKGDLYAFDLIVKRYKDQLLNFVYRFVGSQEEAEDIVQETFLRVYRKRKAYKRIAKFSTWIYTIAGNLSRTELRRRKRRKLFSVTDMGYEDRDYEISDEEYNPENYVEGVIQEEIIHKEINNLSPKFREVIILRDVQELSYEEISKIIRVPIGTVKSRVNRGRLKLQGRLKYLMKKM